MFVLPIDPREAPDRERGEAYRALRKESNLSASAEVRGNLQPLSSGKLAQLAIERAERKVAGLPGGLEDQTVGKAEGRAGAEVVEGGGDDVGVVNHEVLVIEQHLDRVGHVVVSEAT
jgi:hypothetical protein